MIAAALGADVARLRHVWLCAKGRGGRAYPTTSIAAWLRTLVDDAVRRMSLAPVDAFLGAPARMPDPPRRGAVVPVAPHVATAAFEQREAIAQTRRDLSLRPAAERAPTTPPTREPTQAELIAARRRGEGLRKAVSA